MRILAKFDLPSSDWIKLLEHTLLVASAASLTYLGENLGSFDFGIWTPAIVATITVLATWVNSIVNNQPKTP